MLNFDKHTAADESYYYISTGTTESEFRQDIIQGWAEVLRRVQEARGAATWNRLIFECWCERGYIIVYPQKRGDSPDVRMPRIVITINVLNETMRKLEETKDESEMANLLGIAYITVRDAIREVYRKEPALSVLKKTLEANDFSAWTMENSNVETLMTFPIFFPMTRAVQKPR